MSIHVRPLPRQNVRTDTTHASPDPGVFSGVQASQGMQALGRRTTPTLHRARPQCCLCPVAAMLWQRTWQTCTDMQTQASRPCNWLLRNIQKT